MNTQNDRENIEVAGDDRKALAEATPVTALLAHFRELKNTPEKVEIAQLKKKKNALANLLAKQKVSIETLFSVYEEKGGKLAKDKFVRLLKSFAVTKTRLKQKARASEEDEQKPTAPGTDAHQGPREKYFMEDQDADK